MLTLLALLLLATGCAGGRETSVERQPIPEGKARIAVFPAENLSGGAVPLGPIRSLLIEGLKSRGISVLDDDTMARIVTKNRVRYTAGVERGIAKALKEDAGVEGILIPSVELYDETFPPKVAMFCRLVSSGDSPAVLWIDGTGMAGDDSPGILSLGLIEEPQALVAKAVESLVRSLVGYGSEAGGNSPGGWMARRFRPKIVYRSELLDPGEKHSIAVVPFFNKSLRKYAGEIVALHMIRNLMAFENLEVVEPGIVRQELLRSRIIMSDGVSLPQTETILGALNADLVLNGEVLDYQDFRGPTGVSKVDFSVLFIERKTRKIVYSSYSQNAGDDKVYLFDWGRVNTAHALASRMARAIGERMLTGPGTIQTGWGSTTKSTAPQ